MSDATPAPSFAPPGPPPLLCETCRRAQIHSAIDEHGLSWYCEHRQTWALWNPRKQAWRIIQGIPAANYRRILDQIERQAVAMSAGWYAPDGSELPADAAPPAPTDPTEGERA
jgi:hypothetical protein